MFATLVLMLVSAAPRPLADVAKEADVIAVAEVEASHSRWAGNGKRIVTEVTLRVSSSAKGTPAQRVTVIQRGGQVGDLVQRVSNEPALPAHGKVLLFLVQSPQHLFRATAALPVEDGLVEFDGSRRSVRAALATLGLETDR